jgi:DNA-directed RNA polymerase specialized sigma24 family protein
MVNKVDSVWLLESLQELQEPYRAALSLFYLEDYSYKEIAEVLCIPLGTVRSRISRGMTLLQSAIYAGTRALSPRAMLQPKLRDQEKSELLRRLAR